MSHRVPGARGCVAVVQQEAAAVHIHGHADAQVLGPGFDACAVHARVYFVCVYRQYTVCEPLEALSGHTDAQVLGPARYNKLKHLSCELPLLLRVFASGFADRLRVASRRLYIAESARETQASTVNCMCAPRPPHL